MTPIYKEDLIVVENVSKSFGENLILRDINFTVKNIFRGEEEQGQVIGLLSLSGSGKTSLYRLMAGLDQPTTGSIAFRDGEQMRAVYPGCMGIVTQNYIIFEHRTVKSNLLIAAQQNPKIQNKHEAVQIALTKYHLEDKGDLYAGQLSGGQRQRVAIARMILAGPQVILMDEPFSGLDPIMTEKVCSTIKEMAAADGLGTIFVVSHNIEAAVEVSDRILCIGHDYEQGRKLPGAYIKYDFNLAERGLAWRKDLTESKDFHDFMRELYGVFHAL